MSEEETFALSESHGMRGDGADGIERRAGAADEVMLDGEDCFGGDGQSAFQEEIVNADDRSRERVFNRGQESVGEAFRDGAKRGIEGGPRHGRYCFAEELDGRFFAEGAGLALKRDAHLLVVWWIVCRTHPLASLFASAKLGGITGWAQEMRLLPRGTAPYDEMKTKRLQVGARRSNRPVHPFARLRSEIADAHSIWGARLAVNLKGASAIAGLRGGKARYTAPRRRKMKLARPESGEYAAYYEKYIALVPGTDVASALEAQRVQTMQLFAGRSERDGNFRYAADKWTVKEVLGHVSDSERIFTYRALRIARGDQTPMPGFEQDDYVRGGGFNERPLASLVEEFAHVRSASLALFRSLRADAWLRRGTANKNEVSVRALAFIAGGHELHHRQILEERYLSAIPRA